MTSDAVPAAPALRLGAERTSRDALLALAAIVALASLGIAIRYVVFAVTAGGSGFQAYVDALCVWDCAWYVTIAEGGYDLAPGMRLRPGAANWAFFPLVPASAGFVRWATGLPTTLVGFLMSTAFSVATALFSRPLFGANVRAYWLVVVMMTVGPFAFLFNTLYTESLYILLTVLVLVSLQRGHYVAAGSFGALLSATRVTGVLVGLAIFIQALQDHLKAGLGWRTFPARVIQDSKLLLGLVLTPIGLIVYMTFLYIHMGDALAFAHIQRPWGRDLGNPFQILWESLNVPWPLNADGMIVLTWATAATFGLLLCLFLFATGRWAAAAFSAATILVSVSAGVTSMVRFVAGLFPIGMALCEILAANRFVFLLAVVLAVVADVLLMTGWLRSSLFVM